MQGHSGTVPTLLSAPVHRPGQMGGSKRKTKGGHMDELSFWKERLETAYAETPVTKLQIEMKQYRIMYILETIERLEATQ
jgi:hypothetical protein